MLIQFIGASPIMQFQKIIWISVRVTVCHAEPQRSISWPNARDPSLRLRVTREEHEDPLSEEDVMSMAIYPMAIPLLLNPVGIVTLTVFSAESQGLLQIGVLIIMVLIVAVIDFGVFLISHRLYKNVSTERIMVTEKLLGIFLAALAVQLMVNGLEELHIISVAVH
jgi:small neutral amino acid transporter SnatA (MarC family)